MIEATIGTALTALSGGSHRRLARRQCDMRPSDWICVVKLYPQSQWTLTTPMDKVLRSLSAFADEQERERARQRTHDAMMKKAMQKHVTGGRKFGYDNVPVYAPNDHQRTGNPIYKVHAINEGEAAVVRRIVKMIGEGYGLKAVARRLNNDNVPRPRPQRDRPSGWAASSILPMLERDLYRGEIIYNATRRRDD